MSAPSGKIPNLDGIRALAVLVVVVSHFGLERFVPGGFGVTVFFFLSGYLITTLLVREADATGTVSLRAFYLRRVLRIFPPMYLTYGLATLLVVIGLNPTTLDATAVLMQLTHLTNYIELWAPEHWNHVVPFTTVLWSLAVEEHFYLVYPALVLPLLAARAWRPLLLMLVILCLLELGWREWLVVAAGAPSDRVYSRTDTRLDSILYGCVLAVIHRVTDANAPGSRLRGRLELADYLILGVAAIGLVVAFLVRDPAFRDTARYSLQGLALMSVFHYAVRAPRWPGFALLESQPLRWLGVRSYTVYLVSELAPGTLEHAVPRLPVALRDALAVALMLAYAAAMYRLVERPLARIRAGMHPEDPRAMRAVASAARS